MSDNEGSLDLFRHILGGQAAETTAKEQRPKTAAQQPLYWWGSEWLSVENDMLFEPLD